MPDFASYRDPDLRLLCGEAERPRSRGRTDKSATLAKIAEIGRRKNMKDSPKPQTFEESQAALDALTAEAQVLTPERRLYYYLQDLASDLVYAARQLKETGEIEPPQLQFIARRALAAHVAASEMFGPLRRTGDEAILETLQNPHRMKGVELP